MCDFLIEAHEHPCKVRCCEICVFNFCYKNVSDPQVSWLKEAARTQHYSKMHVFCHVRELTFTHFGRLH